nr:MAG TPA: hypothetical protein [Caudoviricetes sp.]
MFFLYVNTCSDYPRHPIYGKIYLYTNTEEE